MHLTTLTAKKFEEQLLELVPYNVYNHKFPKRLPGNLRDYLTFLQKVIQKGKLTSVSTVIVTEITKDNDKTPISLTLYAFGSFRRQFAAMTQLAKVLAPFYLETLVLPVIKPIFSKDWQAESQLQGQIYTEVQKYGILVFSKKIVPRFPKPSRFRKPNDSQTLGGNRLAGGVGVRNLFRAVAETE